MVRTRFSVVVLSVLVGVLAGCGQSLHDQLVGTWEGHSGYYKTFNEDGTYGVGGSPAVASGEHDADIVSQLEWGTWTVEDGILTITPDADSFSCRRYVGMYEIEVTDDGQQMLSTLVEDDCGPRSLGFEGAGTRYTDT